MENQLSCVSILPLKEMTMRKMAISLWEKHDILASITNFYSMYRPGDNDYSKAWSETVESKVRDKLSKALPESLRKQMLPVLTFIGLQIRRWKRFHERYLQMPAWERMLKKYLIDSYIKFDGTILAQLYWTGSGTIDYKRTAERLIMYEMVDVLKRYQLACFYCLDTFYIPILWEELPKEIKQKIYNETSYHIIRPNLQFCWSYILEGELSELDCKAAKYSGYTTFYQHAFQYFAATGNKAATEYFFRKLTHEQKGASSISRALDGIFQFIGLRFIADLFLLEKLSDVVCYLLSQIDQEQRMEMLQMHSCCLLLCFMFSPCQDLLMKNADLIWSFVPARHYKKLLRIIRDYFSDCFPKLFQEFFTHSPDNFRKAFVDRECRKGHFFDVLVDIEDSETVKVIFSNVDAADRVRLVSSKHIFKRFYKCILEGRSHMVEVFLREATLAKEDTVSLKKAFMEFLIKKGKGRIKKRKRGVWMRFLELLDEISASAESSKQKMFGR